jgi:hypothetical protein
MPRPSSITRARCLSKTPGDVLDDPPSDDLVSGSGHDRRDQTYVVSQYPLQLLLAELLQRPIEFTQYLAMRYTDRLAVAGIEPSVGSRGDSYDCEHLGVAA